MIARAGTRAAVLSGNEGTSPDDVTSDDARLVVRARDGDVRAYEQLVRRYQGPIFRLAVRMLASRGDAEDVVQEVFLTAWRSLAGLHEDAAFVGWLYRTATNRCLNVIRARHATVDVDLAQQESRGAGSKPERTVEVREQLAAVTEALQRLTGEQRACWLLREVHGRSYVEIAHAVGSHNHGSARTDRAGKGTVDGDDGAMAVNPETQGYLLPCGRDVETAWERLADVEAGRADEQDLTCPDCRDARVSLNTLREATGELLADNAEPAPQLTGRIMAAIRAEVRRRHDMVPLPTAEPGLVRISEHAVAAVLRFAADSVAGVRARRCRVHDFRMHPEDADGEEGEPMLIVELSVAVSYQSFAWRALDLVRERIAAAAATRIGPRLHRLDLIIEDVYGT